MRGGLVCAPRAWRTGAGEGCRLLDCCLMTGCFACGAAESVRADTLRALPENTARYRCATPLLFMSCGSAVRGIPPGLRWIRGGFVCAPCLANWGGGGLSRFGLLRGGWMFCVWGGGCRLLVSCEMASQSRAEGSVPSVATSGCPKRSEGGCPCRSEDVHRPSIGQHIWVQAHESPPQP